MNTLRRYERYVAIGDSSTEGLDDPDGKGGYRGWADRFAELMAVQHGTLLYANLAVRGRRTRLIREEQLVLALELRPDIATVFAGTNDVVSPRFDPLGVALEIERMQRALVQQGATVLTITLPDLTSVMPLGYLLRGRIARLNVATREASARSGAILVDLAAHAVAGDRRLWSADRLHANALGHERIAAALAHALRLRGSNDLWSLSLPQVPARTRRDVLRGELAWVRRFLVPWIWRHARGRSSGDGRRAKRPQLRPVPVDGR